MPTLLVEQPRPWPNPYRRWHGGLRCGSLLPVDLRTKQLPAVGQDRRIDDRGRTDMRQMALCSNELELAVADGLCQIPSYRLRNRQVLRRLQDQGWLHQAG